MPKKKILYISGSLGLGHITRDLAIANELRKQNGDIDIAWLAAHPASMMIQQAGERLLSEAAQYSNDNVVAEQVAEGNRLNLLKYLTKASKEWINNVEIIKQVTSKEQYDLIIGDETYEVVLGFRKNPSLKNAPFVMIYDFVGLDIMTNNPLDWLGTYIWNRIWAQDYMQKRSPVFDLGLFVGQEDDIADKNFGFMLPNRRVWAKATLQCVGYVFQFDPKDYENKLKIREKLGYGEEPLIVCSVGGTTIGKNLLILCGQAYALMKEKLPDLRMILVCGPSIAADSIDVPKGVEIKEYVPDLYEHFAACDLAIVQGGGTSTLELTALKKPFLFFPIEGHFEQAQVAERLNRCNAGIKMSYSKTKPTDLVEKALSVLGKSVKPVEIPSDGAQRAAHLINELLIRK